MNEWGSDQLLRPQAQRRLVRLMIPGSERPLERELDLLGGERVVLQFNSRDAQLSFVGDGLRQRGYGKAQPPNRDSAPLLVDALDPVRTRRTINSRRTLKTISASAAT